jgi:hypothetical protein
VARCDLIINRGEEERRKRTGLVGAREKGERERERESVDTHDAGGLTDLNE